MDEGKSRERVLSDSEVRLFWAAFDNAGYVESAALKVLLLTGQRPGEVARMHRKHIDGDWWTLPGQPIPELNWEGTKNGQTHRVFLPAAAQKIIADMEGQELVFAGARGKPFKLSPSMLDISKKLGVADNVTAHDLRRTHGTLITGLGFGRDAMNRIQNHREGGISSVYDRHQYAAENKKIMEAVAARIMTLVAGGPAANVVNAKFGAR